MRRTPRLAIAALTVSMFLSVVATEVLAQGQTDSGGGGTRLVVSRASDPTPTPTTNSVYQTVVVRYWEMIAVANAKLSALSFAPARSAQTTRVGAVRRRQIR